MSNPISCFMYASGLELLRDPQYNKGLAFKYEERENHYLTGLLPPAVFTQEMQVRNLHIVAVLCFLVIFIVALNVFLSFA